MKYLANVPSCDSRCSWCLNTDKWQYIITEETTNNGLRHIFICRGEDDGYECGRSEEIEEGGEPSYDAERSFDHE